MTATVLSSAERVLIFRLGSLGDTVVALPSFHLIARSFPAAERRVLANLPISPKAPSIASVLGDSGLVHGYFRYPPGLRDLPALFALWAALRRWRPALAIYLVEPRRPRAMARDVLFLKACGIGTVLAVPHGELGRHRPLAGELWESESARLARCLAGLGDAALDAPASWDLRLSEAERAAGQTLLAGWPGRGNFIAIGIGTKMQAKDWGEENWGSTLARLGQTHRGCGLVAFGSADEADRAQRLAGLWQGPTLNLCGRTSPREGAAVLAQARLFVGHDSGPMHLAAAMGVACVAVFSARHKPGIWYPHGRRHRVLYHRTSCFDCGLECCIEEGKRCLGAIAPAEVVAAANALLATPAAAETGR
ncbi:MAG: glycosyltransferase family 9 protein [Candidatus Hydrogenedens sp.]|nr:glycosyltransferase family 9 protein [Candidatus Hydrogenedens sp.]